MKSTYKLLCYLFAVILNILTFSACTAIYDNTDVNTNITGSIERIYYQSECYLDRPKYHKPSDESESENEYYFSEYVYEYIDSHKKDYVCYTVDVSISNYGEIDIYGYKFQLAKDYGTSVVVYDVFPVQGFEIWESGETYEVSIPILVDKTKFSENDMLAFYNDLSFLFTYETFDHPTLFGWELDSVCLGESTITIN